LIISVLVNGWLAVNTIAPLSLITRLYCSHNGSKGIIVSHEHAVVPYGRSHNIISIEPSGISFIISKQSPWCILFNSSTTHLRPSLSTSKLPDTSHRIMLFDMHCVSNSFQAIKIATPYKGVALISYIILFDTTIIRFFLMTFNDI